MYNWLNKILWLSISFAIVLFFWQNLAIWFDLIDEISSKFQKYYKWWYSDDYMNTRYISVYPKDPFWDTLKGHENKRMQLKIAWVKYIEDVLKENGCYLSQKRMRSILYYYVPEFRTEIERSLKMELWDYSRIKYEVDKNTVYDYCAEYYKCMNPLSDEPLTKEDLKTISARTNRDVESNCKEFFQENYRIWAGIEQRKQDVNSAQLWFDKYWNSSTEDSPYDIMSDISVVWKLLYEDVEPSVTPVFYNIPIFSKSKDELKNKKNTPLWQPREKESWDNWWWNEWWDWWGNWSSTEPDPLPLIKDYGWFDMEWWYWDLVEWVWALWASISSLLKWDPCDDGDSWEPEPDNREVLSSEVESQREYSEETKEEYDELIDFLNDAVDQYTDLSDEKKNEINANKPDSNIFVSATSADDIEETAKKVKSCFEWCEDLRLDQKATCMIMCACWEIESPIFNPEDNPWLWPIFKIRYCAVPGKDMRFSKWWRRIVSIERWVKEILWVLDKLAREWRLWIWTKQYNFLDSTTKRMNFSDTFAFTVDVEFVDISQRERKKSKQHDKQTIKEANESWMTVNKIMNPIDNPVLKNTYRVVGSAWEHLDDLQGVANADSTRKDQSDVSQAPAPMVDADKDSNASRYSDMSENINQFLDQQWDLWIKTLDYTKALDEDAVMLYRKPKNKSK